MIQYRVVATIVMLSAAVNLFAQSSIPFSKSSYIVPYKLEVTYNKTTNIIFTSAITSIDKGSQDIMVEKAVGVDNILRVKADTREFEETNLSVITNDGKLHSFLVVYNDNPNYLNINIGNDPKMSMSHTAIGDQGLSSSPMNLPTLTAYSSRVLVAKSNIHSFYSEASKVSLTLSGIYVKDNALFCKLKIENYSMINYDIDQLRFYIRDKKLSKRTASQEIELRPMYVLGDTTLLKQNSKRTIVVALSKFTIPDGKYMAIEVMERNGGRHLYLRVKNKHIMKAKLMTL